MPVLPPCQQGATLGECIDATVAAFMAATPDLPGAMLSAQSSGATVYRQGYGVIETLGPVPTADNSFQIDSLTKAMTAFAVLRLYEQERILSLGDTLDTYIPSLPNVHWGSIQIDQLLAMVSGIPDISSPTLTYREALAKVAMLPMKFQPPGAQYDYSNSNYFLLGELIDTLVGPSSNYMDYIRDEVLDVFGMPNTGLIDRASAQDPAMPHLQGHPHEGWRDPVCGYSAGGFASTMEDLEAFAIGIANGQVLHEQTYRAMWTNYPLNGGGKGLFGYGWAVTTGADGRMRVQKNGGGYGWSSAVVHTPADDYGPRPSPSASVCVMMNGTGNADALVDDVLTKVIAYGMP